MFRILSKDMFFTVQPACSVLTAPLEFTKHLDHLRIMVVKDYSFLPEELSFKWSLGKATPVSIMPASTRMHQGPMTTCPPFPQDGWLETLVSRASTPPNCQNSLSSSLGHWKEQWLWNQNAQVSIPALLSKSCISNDLYLGIRFLISETEIMALVHMAMEESITILILRCLKLFLVIVTLVITDFF